MRDSRFRLLIALLTAGAALAAVLDLPSAIRAPLGIVLMLVVPGWILATVLLRGLSTAEEIGMLTPPFSLVLTSFGRLAAGKLGLGGDEFVLAWAGLWIAALLLTGLVTGRNTSGVAPSRRSDSVVWWSAVALAALIVLPSVLNHSVRFWGDAPFHGGLVNEIRMRGVPPENPGFAGMPAAYMWIYHLGILALVEATGLSAYDLFFWVNGFMMFALSLAVYRLAVVCWPRISQRRLAPFVVVLGMNAVGFYTAIAYSVAAAFSGQERGFVELHKLAEGLFVHPSADSVNPWLIHLAPFWLSSFIYKFLCPNTLSASLCMIAAALAMASAFAIKGDGRRLVTFAMLVFSAIVIHPVIGIPAGMAMLGGALLGSVKAPARSRFLTMALAVIVAGVVSLGPIFYTVGSSIAAGERTRIHFVTGNTWALVECLLVVVVPAVIGVRALRASRSVLAGFLAGVCISFLAMALTVDYPYSGEGYLVFLAYFGVATLAVGGVGIVLSSERARRLGRWRWVIAALVFLPTPLTQVQGFLRHDNPASTWYPNEPDEVEVFDYVRDRTPPDAVLIDSQMAYSPPSSCYSCRRGYFGGLPNAIMLGYPISEMQDRDRVCHNLFSDPDVSDETLTALSRMREPIYVIARVPVAEPAWKPRGEPVIDPNPKLARYADVFYPLLRTPTITLYEFRPSKSVRLAR